MNTSCSLAEARNWSSWLSMILVCTASVISTNGTSRPNAMSGSPCDSAAATKLAGNPPVYRRPSSTASAATPTEARSAT